MIVRVIDKRTLIGFVSRYSYDLIPREVVDHWVKMYGENITIEPEETEETNSSHTTRACDPKSGSDPGSSDVQSTGGAQECEKNTENSNEATQI